MARYDERGGTGFGADNRDRWREDDRERSSWRSGGEGTSERDDERGFFQRAGDEIRSWFNEDEDDRGPNRDYGRESYGSRSSWDRDNYARSGSSGGGFSSGSSWDRGRSGEFRDRERERNPGRIGSAYSSEDRSSFGGMAQGGRPGHSNRWDRDREQGFGPSRGSGGPWSPSSERSRPSSSSRDFGGFRDESDFRDQRHRGHPQSSDEANRGENEPFGYGKFSGTLGGFGNQTFGSSEHDHYRSWRDRELSKLDRDYDDYCREREHQFNQDFDSWRSKRQSQNPSAVGNASSGDLAAASNAGVGTTTSSMTGTAGAGSEPGSATTQGGTMQSGKTVSTEAADAGRSGSRSRS
jgi:hypothetical protein